MKLGSCLITGTDTDVGKTEVTAALLRYCARKGVNVCGVKPVASGFDWRDGELRNRDIDLLMRDSSVKLSLDQTNIYRFTPAIAPHIAAADEGVDISIDEIVKLVSNAQQQADVVLVEGVGGWLVPLNTRTNINRSEPESTQTTIETMAKALDLPIILVVGMRLGCINHALLTARAIKQSGCVLVGWVANYCLPEFERADENLATLKQMLSAPLLFEMPFLENNSALNSFSPRKLDLT